VNKFTKEKVTTPSKIENPRRRKKILFQFLFLCLIASISIVSSTTKAFAATNVYYSVGQVAYNGSGGNHMTGNPTVTISSGVATFSVAQTGNIGVGDRLTYGTIGVVYLSGRQSTTVWNVETATGAQPTATTSAVVNSIGHEFNALYTAVNQANNSSHLNSSNLTSLNVILNIPCYYDNGPDTTGVNFPVYTTSAADYLQIYTPTSTSQVNQSQRHNGTWTSGAYQLDVSEGAGISDYQRVDFLTIDGLQIQITANTTSNTGGIVVTGISTSDTTAFNISNNLIQGVIGGTASNDAGVETYNGSLGNNTAYIWNNIIYGFANGSNTEYGIYGNGVNTYAYNNTMYNDYRGADVTNSGIFVAKNNIVQNSTVGYYNGSPFTASSTNNISDHADAPGSNPTNSASVVFINPSGSDFLLSSNDTAAIAHGVSLVNDPALSFDTDILNNTRPYSSNAGGAWDIGANEYYPTPATAFTFTGPSGGNINSASTNFTVTPNGIYTGTITITPSGPGSTGLSPVVLTFSGTSTLQNFTITPTTAGSITLTPTNNNSLTNPSNLTYAVSAIPIVTVQAASFLTSTTATLNGTITSIGGANPTTVGFVYGATAAYGATTTQTGSFSTGAFSSAISGLTCGTTYYYSVYAINSYGTSTYPTYSTFTPTCSALIGWWKFDDGSGTTAVDSSGSGYNATLNGTSPTWATGQIGEAVSLNGTDNYVDAGNDVNINSNQMTISAWVKTANSNQNAYIGNMRFNGISGYVLDATAGVFYWGNGTSQQSWSPSGVSPPDNKWTLITVVMDGNRLYYYKNGALAATTTESISGNVGAGAYTLKMGRDAGIANYFYNGSMDDVRIYNQALSASQIAQYFTSNYTPSTYYVSANSGSDSNPGTNAQPFQTIQQGANYTSPGDTVIVENGTYSTTTAEQALVNVSTAGLPGEPITFESQNQGGAVLNGLTNTVQNAWLLYNASSYITIKGFEMLGFSITGINMFVDDMPESNIDIFNNNIHNIGNYCTDTTAGLSGIFSGHHNVSNLVIEGNIIHDIGRFAAGYDGCSPSTTLYKTEDHGVYIDGGTNVTINNNVFYNNHSGWSIQFYDGTSYPTSNFTIENNTFAFPNPYSTGQIILATPGESNGVIQNNIFYNPLNNGINFFECCSLPSFSNITVRNNLAYSAPTTASTPSGVTVFGNLDNTDPLLIATSTYNFQLTPLSVAIESGTWSGLTSTTTDFYGNPIYGTPSLGAYQYQPQFTSGISLIDPTGNIRIYGDGKYRYTTATSSTMHVNLSAAPVGGFPVYDASTTRPEWLDISNINWGTSKTWTASSSTATSTVFSVGNLTPNSSYSIYYTHNGPKTLLGTQAADSTGTLSFTYTNGYSTATFEVDPAYGQTTTAGAGNGAPVGFYSGTGESNAQFYALLAEQSQTKTTTNEPTSSSLTSSQASISGAVPNIQPTTYIFTHSLKQGMTDISVKKLQIFLNDQGFTVNKSGAGSSGHETIFFGVLTKQALMKFQKAHNLPITGFFGPMTRAVINKY
jgi:hypothetical protein